MNSEYAIRINQSLGEWMKVAMPTPTTMPTTNPAISLLNCLSCHQVPHISLLYLFSMWLCLVWHGQAFVFWGRSVAGARITQFHSRLVCTPATHATHCEVIIAMQCHRVWSVCVRCADSEKTGRGTDDAEITLWQRKTFSKLSFF